MVLLFLSVLAVVDRKYMGLHIKFGPKFILIFGNSICKQRELIPIFPVLLQIGQRLYFFKGGLHALPDCGIDGGGASALADEGDQQHTRFLV